jgi:hypothetical protein
MAEDRCFLLSRFFYIFVMQILYFNASSQQPAAVLFIAIA